MHETIAVGRACGVRIPPNAIDTWRAFVRGAPANLTPSMAVDLRAGNRLELPWLAGRVVALGKERGVPTPVNRVIYAALKPYIDGSR
jgi:2-dehydropantoate 2-reductase